MNVEKDNGELVQASHKSAARILNNLADSYTFIVIKVTGYIPSHFVRKLLYRYIFHMTIGRRVVIYYGLEARSPWNIVIEEGSVIGDRVIIDARYGVHIGQNVNISTGAWIWTLQHDPCSNNFSSKGQGKQVSVGDNAWLSSRTVLLPGTHMAKGTVLAAGGVATKPLDIAFGIYGGVPAKLIGHRDIDGGYEFDGRHRWFL